MPMNLEPEKQPPTPPAVQNEPVAVAPTVAEPQTMLERFATYLRDYEGAPGDLNYQLNNPGDCRPSPVGYLAKYEPVEIIDTDTDPQYLYHKGKFAKFPTYDLGWEYLLNLIKEQTAENPAWTIEDFFAHFSPSSDANDPITYAAAIAKRLGVAPTYPMALIV